MYYNTYTYIYEGNLIKLLRSNLAFARVSVSRIVQASVHINSPASAINSTLRLGGGLEI